MAQELPKPAVREVTALLRIMNQGKRQSLPGILPEDFMEMAADRLDDPQARRFFTTVAGFTRLAQIIAEHDQTFLARARDWLGRRFRAAKNPEINLAIEKISEASLRSPNLNVTFKRLTAILNKAERAVMAEGLLDLVAPHGSIRPEHMTGMESVLTRLLLSESMATELLADWQRKRKPKALPTGSA